MSRTLFAETEPRALNGLSDAERNELVESVTDLCRKHAWEAARAANRQQDVEDYQSVAFLAAVEASHTFDPFRGTKFTTYASSYVSRALARAVSSTDPAVGLELWQNVPDPRPDGDEDRVEAEAVAPTQEQERLLARLAEPARTVVRLAVFDRLPPESIAAQLGLAVKDVKLMQRNAAAALQRAAAELAGPDLFDAAG